MNKAGGICKETADASTGSQASTQEESRQEFYTQTVVVVSQGRLGDTLCSESQKQPPKEVPHDTAASSHPSLLELRGRGGQSVPAAQSGFVDKCAISLLC